MLKYKILNNNNTTELVSIDYESYKVGENRDTITFYLSKSGTVRNNDTIVMNSTCLLYTSPSPRDVEESRLPSSA